MCGRGGKASLRGFGVGCDGGLSRNMVGGPVGAPLQPEGRGGGIDLQKEVKWAK